MNVVYIATNSYTSLLGTSLISLLENATDLSELNIYILSNDLNTANKQLLSNVAGKYNRIIRYINVSDYKKAFDFTINTTGFHPIVLARLLLTQYLPADLQSILYLDCDVIVNGSLKYLEQLDLQKNHYSFAAVPELYMPLKQKRNIGLNKSDTYYNCGVLYINLCHWREKNLQQFFIDYYAKMHGNLLYNDQDILNHCCKGTIFTLQHTYNFPPVLYYFPRYFIRKYQPAYYCQNVKEYKHILHNPHIIHFLGEERPWFHGNFSPYKKYYEYYKSISPWKNAPLVYGKEKLLFCYHLLNYVTFICPWFRKIFTKFIGIYYYQHSKKQ